MAKETKREKFKRLAELRTNNAIKQIQLIGNLSNKNNYDYTEEDVKKIFKALKEEIDLAEKKFMEKSTKVFKL
ncbi:MAG TPA: hypothetical protein VIK63_00115 [Haloplasmataceae bacterium]